MGAAGPPALQALRKAGVGRGDRVLVVGASGGVGTFAVQLAVDLGATVTGVSGPAKAELVRSLGAARVIDHTTTSLRDLEGQFDAILDIGGHRSVAELRSLLTERGTLVIVGSEGGGRWLGGLERSVGAALLSPFAKHTLAMFVPRENPADLPALTDAIDRLALRPVVERAFPLEQAAAAVDHVAAGATRGKIIVLGAAS